MKNPIKLLMTSIIVIGGVASLSSCGDSYDGVTINFWHTFGKTVEDGIKQRANEFAELVKEHEGKEVRVKLTYKGGYDDIKGEMTKAFSVGDNPTIAVAYPDHVADYFASESKPGEFVVDMTKYVDNEVYGFGREAWLGDTDGSNDFVEAFYQESSSYTRDGIYSMPFMKSTEVMLYNLDLVRKAMPYYDADISTDDQIRDFMSNLSWDEFMLFCETIKDNMNEISPTLVVPAFYDSDANLFISQCYQNNIPYAGIDANGNGYIGFNGISANSTEEQKKAYNDVLALVKKFKKWYDQGLFDTKGVNGQYSSYSFTPGKTMFAIGSSGGSGYSFPSTSEFQIEACKVPYSNGNPLYVTQGPTLTLMNNTKLIKSGKNDEAVLYGWKFIKYLTNPDVNAALCTNNSEGYIPVRQSAYNTPAFTSFMESDTQYVKVAKVVVNEIQGNYFTAPVFKGSAELREQCGGGMADFLKIESKNPTDQEFKTILDRIINQTVLKM